MQHIDDLGVEDKIDLGNSFISFEEYKKLPYLREYLNSRGRREVASSEENAVRTPSTVNTATSKKSKTFFGAALAAVILYLAVIGWFVAGYGITFTDSETYLFWLFGQENVVSIVLNLQNVLASGILETVRAVAILLSLLTSVVGFGIGIAAVKSKKALKGVAVTSIIGTIITAVGIALGLMIENSVAFGIVVIATIQLLIFFVTVFNVTEKE